MALNILTIGVGGFGRGVCNHLLAASRSMCRKDPDKDQPASGTDEHEVTRELLRGLGIKVYVIDGPSSDARYAIPGWPNSIEIDTSAASPDFFHFDDKYSAVPLLDAIADGLFRPGAYRVQRELEKFLDRDGAKSCPRMAPSEGFGGCRPPGHAYAIQQEATLRQSVQTQIELAQAMNPAPLLVAVVGSVSGGTGAGLLVDIMAMARDVISRTRDAGNVFLLGIVATPANYPSADDFRGFSPDNRRLQLAKGWASFRDLERLQGASPGAPGVLSLSPGAPLVVSKLCDLCLAVEEPTNRPGYAVQATVVPAAADFLLTLAETDNLPGAEAYFQPNLIDWQGQNAQAAGYHKHFGAIRCASVRFTPGECLDSIAPLVLARIVDRILDPAGFPKGTKAVECHCADCGGSTITMSENDAKAYNGTIAEPAFVATFPNGKTTYDVYCSKLQGFQDAPERPFRVTLPEKSGWLFKKDAEFDTNAANSFALDTDHSQQMEWIDDIVRFHEQRLKAAFDERFGELSCQPALAPIHAFLEAAKHLLGTLELRAYTAATTGNPDAGSPPDRAGARDFHEWNDSRLVHHLLASLYQAVSSVRNHVASLEAAVSNDQDGWRVALAAMSRGVIDASKAQLEVREQRSKWARQLRVPSAGRETTLLETAGIKQFVDNYLGALRWEVAGNHLVLHTPSSARPKGLPSTYGRLVPAAFAGGFDADREASYIRKHVSTQIARLTLLEVLEEDLGPAWRDKVAAFLKLEAELLLDIGTTSPHRTYQYVVGVTDGALQTKLRAAGFSTFAPAVENAHSISALGVSIGIALDSMAWASTAEVEYERHVEDSKVQPVDIYRKDVIVKRFRAQLRNSGLPTGPRWCPDVVNLLEYGEPVMLFALVFALGGLPTVELSISGTQHRFVGFKDLAPWAHGDCVWSSHARRVPGAECHLLFGLASDPIWCLRSLQHHYDTSVTPPREDEHSKLFLRDLQVRVFGLEHVDTLAKMSPDKGVSDSLRRWYTMNPGSADGLLSGFGTTIDEKWAAVMVLDGTQVHRVPATYHGSGLLDRTQRSVVHTLTVTPPANTAVHEHFNLQPANARAYSDLQHALRAGIARGVSQRIPTENPSRAITGDDLDAAEERLRAAARSLPGVC